MDIVILIPSLNPDKKLIELIYKLNYYDFKNIIIVNDGSGESYSEIFNELKKIPYCVVLTHEKNMGKGAALKTGISYIDQHFPSDVGIVTADADGRHSAEDILNISGNLRRNPDALVLGVRNFDEINASFKNRFGNKTMSAVFRAVTGQKCSDTQTGLRGVPLSMAHMLLKTDGQRFEYEMNMLMDFAEANIKFIEIPIQTIYADNNRQFQFRPLRDSVLVYGQILKFCLSSILSSFVDIFFFTLFRKTIFINSGAALVYSSVYARILSGIVNYTLNKKAVFKDKGGRGKAFVKYAVMFTAKMMTSSFLVILLKYAKYLNITFGKIVIDTLLFFFSYIIQKRFVFINSK